MSKEVIDSRSLALHQNSLLRSDVDGARSYLQAAVFSQALTNNRYLSSQYYRGFSPYMGASVLLSGVDGWFTLLYSLLIFILPYVATAVGQSSSVDVNKIL